MKASHKFGAVGVLVITMLVMGCEHLAAPAKTRGYMPLAEAGQAKAAIVVGAEASPSTRYAAGELQRFLNEITGASFEIISDEETPRAGEIIVGNNRHLEKLHPAIDFAALGEEGYVLRSTGKNLIIAGGEPRGTLYGVYGLLEDHLDCRWFTPQVSRIPKNPQLTIGPLDEFRKPILEYREPFVLDCFDGDWSARNRMNSSAAHLEEKHGGKVDYFGFVHTFAGLLPVEKYFDTHPEYYSLINGQRRKERTQLCCTNEDVIRLVTEEVKRRMREHPEAEVFSVSQNDWLNYCECDKCTALAEAEGSQMGPMLHLVNAVARAVRDEFPDKAIDTLAYQYTRKPPRTLRPEPNVIIRLCSIECDFSHPFEERATPENAAFCDDLEGWAKVSQRLWVWNYNTSFSNYFVPYPNLKVRGPNIRYMIQNNVRGIFEQDVYTTLNGEFSPLSGYLGAKLLWNPGYDTDLAINEFLEGVYEEAAAPLRQYLDLIHAAVADPKTNMHIWIGPDEPFLTDALLEQASVLMDKAERAVADKPEVLERVRAARLSVDYVMLERMRARATDAYDFDHEHFTLALKPAFQQRVQRFFDVAERNGVTAIRESNGALADYKAMIMASITDKAAFTPAPGKRIAGIKPGLRYAYYEKALDLLPDFSTMKPAATGAAETIDLTPAVKRDAIALRFDGYIHAPHDGLYTFSLRSNDGSRLYLNGKTLVDNDGLHKMETKTGFAALRAGWHAIKVEYFESGGSEDLALFWAGPGIDFQPVPTAALGHRP